jgi:hypothetical protein
MTNPERRQAIDTQDLRRRHARLSRIPVRCPLGYRSRRPDTSRAATCLVQEIPALCEEIERLRSLLAAARRDQQDLVAAARATLAAAAEGEPGPLYYLHDELRARGLLPVSRGEQPW